MYMYTELMQQHTMVAEKKSKRFNGLLHWKGLFFDWTQWSGLHFKERTVKRGIKLKCRTHCLGSVLQSFVHATVDS